MIVKRSKPTIISVAGPIASGKTTLTSILRKRFSWKPLLEPAPEKHNPFFSLYYSDPRNYTFQNEINFMVQAAELYEKLWKNDNRKNIYVQDHLPFANVSVYAYVQRQFGYLTKLLLKRTMEVVRSSYIPPSLVVYRHVNDHDMIARIRARARPGENSADSNFLSSIKNRYDSWISSWRLSPVLHVNSVADVESNKILRALGKRIYSVLKC